MSQYNVTKYPTIVVDNTKYEGVVDKEEMNSIICTSLRDSPECLSK
jgi:protein-disulfide isomerase